MPQHSIRFALIAICVISTCARLRGGTILTPLSEGYEALMISQSHDGSCLGGAFGSTPATTLTFNSFVDPTARTFSYTLAAGQTFHGEALSLTTTGAFNVAMNRYDVSTVGLMGASSFNRTSTVAFNPDLSVDASSDWNTPAAPGSVDGNSRGTGINCQITSRTILTFNPFTLTINSEVTYTAKLTFEGSTITIGEGTGTDSFDFNTGTWHDRLRPWLINAGPPVPGTDVDSESLIPAAAGAGQFKMVVDLPEPSAAVLMGFAAAGSCLRRRRGKSR